ncbi:hypothetical protein KC866_00550 [Patescibacteria group bacterium]|nr:hypothetical protein [Patescibacteria group bacterium]
MGLKIWNRTTIVWENSPITKPQTNIRVKDWKDESKNYFHTIDNLQITSLDENGQREGLITLDIWRVSISPTTERQFIVEKLMCFDEGIIGVKAEKNKTKFSIRYQIQKGENFSDSAIRMAKQLFSCLGIIDKDFRYLSNFIVVRESLVRTKEKGLIPYSDYLRHKHELPQWCSLWGTRLEVNGLSMVISYKNAESNWLKRMHN